MFDRRVPFGRVPLDNVAADLGLEDALCIRQLPNAVVAIVEQRQGDAGCVAQARRLEQVEERIRDGFAVVVRVGRIRAVCRGRDREELVDVELDEPV